MTKIQIANIHTDLERLKTRSGMTLEQISRASGVPRSTIGRYLASDDLHCNIAHLCAIVTAMGGTLWLSDVYGDEPTIIPDQQNTKQEIAAQVIRDYSSALEMLDTNNKRQHRLILRLQVAFFVILAISIAMLIITITAVKR